MKLEIPVAASDAADLEPPETDPTFRLPERRVGQFVDGDPPESSDRRARWTGELRRKTDRRADTHDPDGSGPKEG